MDLVIFDCDGVLVDSEPIACEVVAQVMTEAGFHVSLSEFFTRFAGVSDREMYAQLETQYRSTIGEALRQRVNDEILAALGDRLEPIPGITSVLQAIDLPMCVASGSDRRRVETSLAKTGLLPHFDSRIFTSHEVPRGKPAPDLFLHAAGRMRAEPSRCVVIEDSEAGVRAAVAAGMPVLGFVGGSHCSAERADVLRSLGARIVFDRMAELPRHLDDCRQSMTR